MAVTKQNCKFVGGLSALVGLVVLVMSTVFFDQCLNLNKRYAPTEHLQSEHTKKNYRLLIVIGMIGIFAGVAQFLMSLTMYWGVDKKITEYVRVYLFCIGETLTTMLLIACFAVAIVCKAYLITKGLLRTNYETVMKDYKKTEADLEEENKQVTNYIGTFFCIVLVIDIFCLLVSLLYLGFKLKGRAYENVS